MSEIAELEKYLYLVDDIGKIVDSTLADDFKVRIIKQLLAESHDR